MVSTGINRQSIDALQSTADYKSLRKILVSAGISSFIFGVLAIASSTLYGIRGILFITISFLFGMLLLGIGIWLIAGKPRAMELILCGILFISIGMWNLISAGSIFTGNTLLKIFLQAIFILGLFQIIWGLRIIPRYGRFHHVSIQKPSDENQGLFDEVANNISGLKPADSKDVIEFIPADVFTNKWKGKLEEKLAIFVQGKGDDMLVASQEQVNIEPGDTSPGKSVKACLQIGKRKIKGTLSLEDLYRYEAWKSGDKS